MRDGVRLYADVYHDETPRPVLVHQPYQNRRTKESAALMLNPLNAFEPSYAVVIADARGHLSGGR